jgi:osmotically-inducible protein OsmY
MPTRLELAEVEPDAPTLTRRERFEEHVRVQVVSRLVEHAVDRFRIHVAVEGARVEIHGIVPDTLTSQLAEDLVWSVPAVRQCDNRLRVG